MSTRIYHQTATLLCTGLALSIFSLPSGLAYGAPTCDIRQLDLTPIQKAKLRFIRMQHKMALENPQRSTTRNTLSQAQLLNQPDFDEGQAKRFVIDRYAPRMQNDVNELRVQHAFLQVLNHQQRQEWLRNCLR